MTSSLSAPTIQWFNSRFESPTAVQKDTWSAVAEGNHLLAVAPTGSGKTLAAFLVALDRLFESEVSDSGLKVLYLSPLKALGSDIRENLGNPLRELRTIREKHSLVSREIRVGIRNGDTTPYERRKQLKKPPEILITTPESLGILLLSESGREMLSTVETCIVDEIHAIAPDRRGTLLACHLERLVDLAGEYQRIGLTATVNPVERAAAFLGGFKPGANGEEPQPRDVSIIAPPAKKKIIIEIESLPETYCRSMVCSSLFRGSRGSVKLGSSDERTNPLTGRSIRDSVETVT